MKTYTPNEMRIFAQSRAKNPFWNDEAVAALMYAANVLEAADEAVKAERKRADALRSAIRQPEHPAERNFCERCGKRLSDSEYIHTCSLPESKA